MKTVKRLEADYPKDITDLRLIFRKLLGIVETANMRNEIVKIQVSIVQPDYSPKR